MSIEKKLVTIERRFKDIKTVKLSAEHCISHNLDPCKFFMNIESHNLVQQVLAADRSTVFD